MNKEVKSILDELIELHDKTTTGYRTKDYACWYEGWNTIEGEKKPAILVCEHPGNLINPVCYKPIASFEDEDDMKAVAKSHHLIIKLKKILEENENE